MVSLDPHFALLAVQCMVLLAALPSPVTAVVVRSPHSNGSGHFRQRDPHPTIPAPGGAKKRPSTKHHALSSASGTSKHKARDDNHAIEADFSSEGLQAKKTRDLGILQARDPPADNLQALLASLLDALGTATDTLKSVLTGLVRRHHDRDDHCHDCDNTYEYINNPSHVHEHNRLYNRGLLDNHMRERRDMDSDLVPGTALVTDNKNAMLGFLRLDGDVFNASENNATTLYLKSWPGSDGQNQRVQLVLFSQGTSSYCATYDPHPSKPSAITARPCTSQPTYHQSQFFSYDAVSGNLQPMKATEEDSSPATDGDGDDQATDENVRLLVRSSGTGLKFVSQEMGMKDISPSSTTTVTVTETATQTDPSFTGAAMATPPIPANATNALDSMPTPDPSSMLPPLPGVVEVGYPSNTSTGASPDVSPTLSTDPSSVAASIATEDATTSETSTSPSPTPTPASLIVEITQPADPSGSAASSA